MILFLCAPYNLFSFIFYVPTFIFSSVCFSLFVLLLQICLNSSLSFHFLYFFTFHSPCLLSASANLLCVYEIYLALLMPARFCFWGGTADRYIYFRIQILFYCTFHVHSNNKLITASKSLKADATKSRKLLHLFGST